MMSGKGCAAVVLTALVAAPAGAAGSAKVIAPLAAGLVGAADVVGTTVVVGDKAKLAAAKLDAKAAGRAAAAPRTDVPATRPEPAAYDTLPLTAMLPLEIEDATRDWGLTTGRPVRLAITIDAVRVPDAALSTLVGVTDELAGTVTVLDAASGDALGAFRVVVIDGHAGVLGLATRGSDLREKLAVQFAERIARQLSGSKHKPKAA